MTWWCSKCGRSIFEGSREALLLFYVTLRDFQRQRTAFRCSFPSENDTLLLVESRQPVTRWSIRSRLNATLLKITKCEVVVACVISTWWLARQPSCNKRRIDPFLEKFMSPPKHEWVASRIVWTTQWKVPFWEFAVQDFCGMKRIIEYRNRSR